MHEGFDPDEPTHVVAHRIMSGGWRGRIAERFEMARPSVSEHLKVLLERNLVSEERVGRTIRYRLTPEPLADVSSWLSPFEAFWRTRLKSLSTTLDGLEDR